ncbi:MAG: DNA-directed RNA polymerase subunit L [archaeon]
METVVLEKTKKKLVFELKGADHTLCGALKQELYNDKAVKVATYSMSHPLTRIPKLIIETDGTKSPAKALIDAAKRIQKDNETLAESIKKFKISA